MIKPVIPVKIHSWSRQNDRRGDTIENKLILLTRQAIQIKFGFGCKIKCEKLTKNVKSCLKNYRRTKKCSLG